MIYKVWNSLRGQIGPRQRMEGGRGGGVNIWKIEFFASYSSSTSHFLLNWEEIGVNKNKNNFWWLMKHGSSLRGEIGPREGIKWIKNWFFLHLIPHPPIILLMIDKKQCKLKEKRINVKVAQIMQILTVAHYHHHYQQPQGQLHSLKIAVQ